MLNNEYTYSIISLMHVCNTDKYLQHEPENKNKNINFECFIFTIWELENNVMIGAVFKKEVMC